MTQEHQLDVTSLPDEVLDLISVGAYTLAGGTPDDSYGQHTDDLIDADAEFSEVCRSCQAVRWLDVVQAEIRRRAPDPAKPATPLVDVQPSPFV